MPGTSKSFTAAARLELLGSVTAFVRTGAQEAGLSELQIGQLELLTEEIFVNICRYSYPETKDGPVTISFTVPKTGELAVEFEDHGIAFDPLSAPDPDLTLSLEQRPVGGLGIFLLKTFAGPINYHREQGLNRLRFGISAGS